MRLRCVAWQYVCHLPCSGVLTKCSAFCSSRATSSASIVKLLYTVFDEQCINVCANPLLNTSLYVRLLLYAG
jgi:hypothetical protein